MPGRRYVQVELPEETVEEIIEALFASESSVKAQAIPLLRDALLATQAPRRIAPPKRLAFFHDFCELSPDEQAVVADVVSWLRLTKPGSLRRVQASLDVLARVPTPKRPKP